jgi:hypothetical protein
VLPRTPRKALTAAETEDKVTAPATTGTARKADDWNSLVAELRKLQKSEWTGLRESLAINQTQAFARKLHTLAHATHCSSLSAYAELLNTQAQTYAVRDLEKQLAEFPALVQEIEQHSLTPPNV